MTETAYDLAGVSKRYPFGQSELSVLNDIHLTIPRGQFVAIMGPSGSGKTTLMHLMGCLDFPSEGKLLVFGKDVSALSDDDVSNLRCRTMGFIFQHFHLLAAYDALSNVALAMAYSGRGDRWERAEHLLQKLGLGHRLRHRPHVMSGGERQRVAIGRALANDPSILLADEPTGALDQANGRLVLDFLSDFHREGKTVILVTHDPDVASRAERIIQMVDGRIVGDHDGFTRSL